ncbi:MAG TPA: HAMP domain-containing sensor histidine kinase [Nitrososphaeraceae archaeon]|nr:HAMP domain-containing sensor histidine kinase [Nitrososphaeraceae archaeon]
MDNTRIGEIKEPTTLIVHGSDKVVDRRVQFMQKAHRINICVDNTRPLLAIEFKQIRDAFIDAKRRGVAVRYITEITKNNVSYCKELMSIVELRHLDGIKGNFYVAEDEYVALSTVHEKGEFSEWMIYSDVKEIVEHQQYIFDRFWNTSTFAERKILEIQNGASLGITEIIDNPSKTQELFIDLIKTAKSEVLLMLPTVNSFMREYRIGVIQLLEELSTQTEGRLKNIRILTPINNTIKKILEEMKTKATLSEESDDYYNSNLKLRHLESEPNLNVTTATILVVDRKASLAIEKVNDSSERFIEAVGLSSYSTSQPTVISYLSIFENFWNQLELYQKLKQHDKMQQEFINIAAHELRTPAQSILGYAELAKTEPQNEKQTRYIDGMYRNASRIQKLTKDILDVTRIESDTLRLNKIKFDLKEVILNAIEDTKLMFLLESNKVKLEFRNMIAEEEVASHSDDIFVVGDRNRITQVISNLLDNALKFTSEGVVSVDVAIKKRQAAEQDHHDEATVTVEDTGSGINPEIFPKLFTKFSTKSFSGTGLGLYISKSIIEAHDGKIWAQNNNDHGKNGATFSFSLPLN